MDLNSKSLEKSTFVRLTSSFHKVCFRYSIMLISESLVTSVSSISSSNNWLHLTTSMLICSSGTSHRPPRLNFLTFVTIMCSNDELSLLFTKIFYLICRKQPNPSQNFCHSHSLNFLVCIW